MRRRTFLQGIGAVAGASLAPSAWAEDKPGRWLRLESPRFIYFSTGDEQKARNEVAALEHYHAVLEKLIPREQRSEMKLTVYAAANSTDLNRTWPGVPSDVAGFYDASVEHMRAITAPFRAFERQRDMPKNVRAMDARVILFHEYAHHFMKANLRTPYPRWYGEGFAELASTVDFATDGTTIGKFTNLRASWLLSGDWLQIEKFLDPGDLSRDQTALYYAQAWLASHYIFTNSARAAGFNAYVLALANGGDPIAAFEPAFGITPSDFDKELRSYKRQKIALFKLNETAQDYASDIKVERLTPAADDLLMPMSYIRVVPPGDKAKDTVAIVRDKASKYPDDLFAQRSLATVELWYGDPEKTRSLLDKLVASSPTDPEVLHLSGLCDLRQAYRTDEAALFKKARGQFTAAHRLDSTRANSLFRYVECLTHMEESFTQNMLDVALEAYRLAPQTAVLQLLAAQGLLQNKQWKEAQGVLLGLMTAVHESDTGNRARSLMAAAKAEQVPPLVFYGAANTMELQPE